MKIKGIYTEEIEFEDGSILSCYHEQDCCEQHYLDFSGFADNNVGTATGKFVNVYEQDFDFSNGIPFSPITDMGINLIDTEGNKYFIPGYGSNNGYYSSNLSVEYLDKNKVCIYSEDISDCQDIDWN